MDVAIDSPTPNHPPIAEELFRTNLPAIFAETAYPYDVSAHGDRFLIKVEPKPRPLRVILNWNALIKQ